MNLIRRIPTKLKVHREEASPFRMYKYNKDLSSTYYYECEDLQPIGRVIQVLKKKVKTLDNCKAIYILNPEKLVFSGTIEFKHRKYFDFYKAGSWTKGPYIERSPKGLFKYLFRRAIAYKTKDKELFKKLCVFSEVSVDKFKKLKSKKIDCSDIKKCLYSPYVSMELLFKRI